MALLRARPFLTNAGFMSGGNEVALSEAEVLALRMLAHRPKAAIASDVVGKLVTKALIERLAESLILTARGHAALQEKDAK